MLEPIRFLDSNLGYSLYRLRGLFYLRVPLFLKVLIQVRIWMLEHVDRPVSCSTALSIIKTYMNPTFWHLLSLIINRTTTSMIMLIFSWVNGVGSLFAVLVLLSRVCVTCFLKHLFTCTFSRLSEQSILDAGSSLPSIPWHFNVSLILFAYHPISLKLVILCILLALANKLITSLGT